MDVQAKIIEMWDRASEKYDTHTGHGMNNEREEAAWRDALRALLPSPPAKVLDVGTGTGVIALLLADLGYSVRGVDLSEKMLSHARRKATEGDADVRFEIGDATAPPGEPESVDVVFSRHVIHLLTNPQHALTNWFRLLRPGGRVVIIDGLWGQDPEDRISDDIQAVLALRATDATIDDVRRLVVGEGFVNVTVSDVAAIDRIEHELATEKEPAPNIPHYVVTAWKPA
jgi:ubiquinone/menaquinone biosynthesis C-methylase UbiE